MAIDPQITATLLTEYNAAREVLGWLCDNGNLGDVVRSLPGSQAKIDELARQFACGPGPVGSNFKATLFANLMGKG